jgi:hypothetical protein
MKLTFQARAAMIRILNQGKAGMQDNRSPLELQAAEALRRARKLPVGADRNDLRQLGTWLLWLHRHGMDALVAERQAAMRAEVRQADDTF